MQNFLLTDEFVDDLEVSATNNNNLNQNLGTAQTRSLTDTHSSLGRERENEAINIMNHQDIGNTRSNQPDLFNQSARLNQDISQAVQFADTLKINDLENTRQSSQHSQNIHTDADIPTNTRDMIQNVNFDIDNFINNARIIQDSINEAMTYTEDVDPNLKEEMFRTDLKMKSHN